MSSWYFWFLFNFQSSLHLFFFLFLRFSFFLLYVWLVPKLPRTLYSVPFIVFLLFSSLPVLSSSLFLLFFLSSIFFSMSGSFLSFLQHCIQHCIHWYFFFLSSSVFNIFSSLSSSFSIFFFMFSSFLSVLWLYICFLSLHFSFSLSPFPALSSSPLLIFLFFLPFPCGYFFPFLLPLCGWFSLFLRIIALHFKLSSVVFLCFASFLVFFVFPFSSLPLWLISLFSFLLLLFTQSFSPFFSSSFPTYFFSL